MASFSVGTFTAVHLCEFLFKESNRHSTLSKSMVPTLLIGMNVHECQTIYTWRYSLNSLEILRLLTIVWMVCVHLHSRSTLSGCIEYCNL